MAQLQIPSALGWRWMDTPCNLMSADSTVEILLVHLWGFNMEIYVEVDGKVKMNKNE